MLVFPSQVLCGGWGGVSQTATTIIKAEAEDPILIPVAAIAPLPSGHHLVPNTTGSAIYPDFRQNYPVPSCPIVQVRTWRVRRHSVKTPPSWQSTLTAATSFHVI